MERILASTSIGISELKMNPMATIEKARSPVAILNRNKPVAYLIPASAWEAICDRLEDVNGLQESLHLLGSPENARRLSESIAQFRADGAARRGLIDESAEEGAQQAQGGKRR